MVCVALSLFICLVLISDSNDDCGQGLVCFQRDKTESVPGCAGKGDDGWDYCVKEQYASQISKL